MEFIQITSGETAQIEKLSAFASEIVREHYDPIIGPEQNSYMIEKFQSAASIQSQIVDGYLYYIAVADGIWRGFFAVKPENGKMFLSKLYVHKSSRGQGYASQMLDFIKTLCAKQALSAIWLRVNRENSTSIQIYNHLGFHIVRTDKADIGHGYWMDDYILELPLT
jgi:GNAT superfamily N-acetyltransferase